MDSPDGSSQQSWSDILRGFVAEVGGALAGALKWAFVFGVIFFSIWLIDIWTQSETRRDGQPVGGIIAWFGSITKGEFGPGGFSFEREVQEEQTRRLLDQAEEISALKQKVIELATKVASIEVRESTPSKEESIIDSEDSELEKKSENVGGGDLRSASEFFSEGGKFPFKWDKEVTNADIRLQELTIAQALAGPPIERGFLTCGAESNSDRSVLEGSNFSEPNKNTPIEPGEIIIGSTYRLLKNKLLFASDKSAYFGSGWDLVRALPVNTIFTIEEAPSIRESFDEKANICIVSIRLLAVPKLTGIGSARG